MIGGADGPQPTRTSFRPGVSAPVVSTGGEVGAVFVPGAGLGAWIWDAIAPHLDLPCLFADFPGREGNGATKGLRLDDYVRHVRDQVDQFHPTRLVIVAHSLGGVVALKLAAGLSDRLAGFVGIGAVIPNDGGSFVSSLPLPKRVLTSVLTRVAGTKPPQSAIRTGLCNDLPTEEADEVVRKFVPESRALYTDRTQASAPDVARLYVCLTEDKELGVPLQRAMASNLDASDMPEIASGHMPMLSEPDELTRILNRFAARLATTG